MEAKAYTNELLKQLEDMRHLISQNQRQEDRLEEFEQIIADLRQKSAETEILFDKCQEAYFESLKSLKAHSDMYVSQI